jgi:hypothetical protein
MSLSNEEINKLNRVFGSEEEALSRRAVRQHTHTHIRAKLDSRFTQQQTETGQM